MRLFCVGNNKRGGWRQVSGGGVCRRDLVRIETWEFTFSNSGLPNVESVERFDQNLRGRYFQARL